MDLDAWYDHARRDATGQDLPGLVPLLDMLQRATHALRTADWAQDARNEDRRGTLDDAEGGAHGNTAGGAHGNTAGGAPDHPRPAAARDRSPRPQA